MTATMDKVRALSPLIVEWADEIERARKMPAELIAGLREAGVFRMYVPRSHGGDELSALDVIEVIEELSTADGSVGWIATIGADSPAIFCHFPADTYDEIYRDGADVIHAGSLVPRGRAVRCDGGFRFSGQWPFASGCEHADYVAFNAFVVDSAAATGESMPEIRAGLVRANQVRVVDTWYVNGLRGTGSHDIAVDDLFVAESWTTSLLTPPSKAYHPLDALPILGRLGVELAACGVGIAQGAVDDVIAIAQTRRPLGGLLGRVAEEPVFQYKLGRAEADLRTARILLRHVVAADAEVAGRGGQMSDQELLERRTLLNRIAELASSVVDASYGMSGTAGLFTSSPLQRRLRDIRALTQHVALSSNCYTPAGARLLGMPTTAGFF